MKLPKSVKNKWIKALLSGKYRQGQNVLYDPDYKTFCCLGVLQHCTMDGNVEPNFDSEDSLYVYAPLPSAQFWDSLGLVSDEDESIREYDGAYDGGDIGKLALMNDNGKGFIEIADYIKKHVGTY